MCSVGRRFAWRKVSSGLASGLLLREIEVLWAGWCVSGELFLRKER